MSHDDIRLFSNLFNEDFIKHAVGATNDNDEQTTVTLVYRDGVTITYKITYKFTDRLLPYINVYLNKDIPLLQNIPMNDTHVAAIDHAINLKNKYIKEDGERKKRGAVNWIEKTVEEQKEFLKQKQKNDHNQKLN